MWQGFIQKVVLQALIVRTLRAMLSKYLMFLPFAEYRNRNIIARDIIV